jgi:small nuclear ribonucleoprotein (snRNP)-like protein
MKIRDFWYFNRKFIGRKVNIETMDNARIETTLLDIDKFGALVSVEPSLWIKKQDIIRIVPL